jgi:hypothetical protein
VKKQIRNNDPKFDGISIGDTIVLDEFATTDNDNVKIDSDEEVEPEVKVDSDEEPETKRVRRLILTNFLDFSPRPSSFSKTDDGLFSDPFGTDRLTPG